ncbi:MAG: ATP-binding protein, partial [Streptomyces sp.]|nr:ATP-binding protein [Streptomyces sp.]
MGTEASTVLDPLWQGLPETARRQVLPPVDPGAVAGAASCALPAAYEAVSGARSFTVTTLRHWELDGLCDDVALVVSELVTNALRHALPPGPGGSPAESAGDAEP